LVESVLVSANAWVLITQVEVYISNHLHLDDCAFQRTGPCSATPTVHFIDKNHYKATWKELVIRWGNFEFLVLGGYCGERYSNKRKAFLGHSIPTSLFDFISSNDSNDNNIFDIVVPVTPVHFYQSTRYLRDFTKTSARRQWAFGSRRFIKNGFEATHALEID
ncbi:hypothetical protein BDA99DRAFT_417849, partial [Phascolomyces articulosus]